MNRSWKIATAVAGAIAAVVLLRGCVATSYLIPSQGMENSLYRGERILVNKWSYGLRLPFMGLWGYHRWRPRPVGKGDIVVFNNPANTRESVVSRRETFIGRCVGLPGDTLLVDSLFAVTASMLNAPDQKFLYSYPRDKERLLDSLLCLLGIDSGLPVDEDTTRRVRSFSRYEHYLLQQAMPQGCWLSPLPSSDPASLRPLVVPTRGKEVVVHRWNMALLCNTLVLHEGRRAEIKDDTLYVDGHPATTCRFTKDYYWVVSNNPANITDSRLFGFVPCDHLIGRAARVWLSKEQGSGPFAGYRWERVWMPVN